MLLTRSTYNNILDFGLNESAALVPTVSELCLGLLRSDGEIELLDIARIPAGEWEEANGAYRNVRSRVFINNTLSAKEATHLFFLSSSGAILAILPLPRRVTLNPGQRVAYANNALDYSIRDDEVIVFDTGLAPIEASASGTARLDSELFLGLETGARLYTYLTFSVNAVGTGVLGNMQLYAYPIELENTFLRIRATASGSATLTSEANTGVGEAVGVSSLTGSADGVVVVIAVSDSLGPLVGAAEGQVRVTAQASTITSLTGDSSASTDVPAVADSLGPLFGATVDANTRIKFNAIAVRDAVSSGIATAEVTVSANANGSPSLTGTSDGISAAFATASGSASLAAMAAGSTDVPGVADTLGPLVGDAVGDVRVFADAAGTATLTTDVTSTTDVPAAADALGPLTGVADGQISLLRVSASATSSAVGDAAGSVIVSADASATANLTVDADGGTVPLLISDAVVSFLSGQGDINTPLEGDVIETTLGVWESDPTLIDPTDYTIQWQRVSTGPVTEVVNWIGTPGYTNVSHDIQADGGIAKTSGPSSGSNSAHKSEDVNNIITLEGGSIQFRANSAAAIGVGLGLVGDPDVLSSVYFNTFEYSFFLLGGQYSVRENGTNVAANIGTYTTADVFTIERNPTTDEIEYKFNGTTVYTSLNLINDSDDLYPAVSIIQSGGEVIESSVTRNNVTQITPIAGANSAQYTIIAADEGFQIRSSITVNNGYIQSADVEDITSTSNVTGVASSTFPASASASASLAGQSASGVDTFASADATAELTGNSNASITLLRADASATVSLTGDSSADTDVPAVADTLGPLTGTAEGILSRQPGVAFADSTLTTVAIGGTASSAVAFDTSTLTGNSNASITLLRADASATVSLTGDSSANTDVNAVADSLGPLVGVADGQLSRISASASAASILTTVAAANTDVPAVADTLGPLTGAADGQLSRIPASADAAASLTTVAAANTDVNAVADALGPLVGVADGVISLLRADASGSASLTSDAGNGAVTAFGSVSGTMSLTGVSDATSVAEATADASASLTGAAAGGTVPLNIVAPVVSGNLVINETLSVTEGTWESDPALVSPTDYSYQWRRETASSGDPTWVANTNGSLSGTIDFADGTPEKTANNNSDSLVYSTESISPTGTGAIEFVGDSNGLATNSRLYVGLMADPASKTSFSLGDFEYYFDMFKASGGDSLATNGRVIVATTEGRWFGNPTLTIELTPTEVVFSSSQLGGEIRRETRTDTQDLHVVFATSRLGGQLLSNTLTSSAFADIAGATNNTYTLVLDDVDNDIDCTVTANNGFGGNIDVQSNVVGPISGTIEATASATASLTGDSSANTDVPAVADTLGPLVGVANGILSRQPGVADATASLTAVAVGGTAASAVAFATSGLTGDAGALVTASAVASATPDLTGAADGTVTAFATSSATPSLTGDADGTSVAGASADATSDLTGAAAGGTVPLNTVAPVVSGSAIINQTLSVTDGTWESDPALQSADFSYQWRRTAEVTVDTTWVAASGNANVAHTPQADGGLSKDSGSSIWGNSSFVGDEITGDGNITFQPTTTSDFFFVGLTEDPNNIQVSTPFSDYEFSIYIRSGGDARILEDGVEIVTGISYTASDTFEIRRTGSTITFYQNGSLIHTATLTSSATLTAAATIFNSGGEIESSTVTSNSLVNVGLDQNTYTLGSSDIGADISCIVIANNGFGGDIEATSNAVGPVVGVFQGDAAGTAILTGDAVGDVASVATATGTSSLTGAADGNLSLIPAVASGTSELTSTVQAGVEIGAAASSMGPLTGSAAGNVSLLRADASSTSDLTGDAAGDVAASASTDATASLTGDSQASVTASGSAAGTSDLTGDADATATISATADATADLTGDSDGIIVLSASASADAELTTSATAAGVSPTNVTAPELDDANIYNVGQSIEISEGTWDGDPDPTI